MVHLNPKPFLLKNSSGNMYTYMNTNTHARKNTRNIHL